MLKLFQLGREEEYLQFGLGHNTHISTQRFSELPCHNQNLKFRPTNYLTSASALLIVPATIDKLAQTHFYWDSW